MDIIRLESEKILPFFKSVPLTFSIYKVWCKNKMRQLLLYLFFFWTRIWKSLSHIWNEHSQMFPKAKFRAKMKILKSSMRNSLFGFFGQQFSKGYCRIWSQRSRLCLTLNFGAKVKSKMPDLGSFGLEFENDIVIFETNALESHKWVFNSYSEFWYRSAFPKIPKSVFSERPVCFIKYARYTV